MNEDDNTTRRRGWGVGGAAAVHFVTELWLDSASAPLDADTDADADAKNDDDVGGCGGGGDDINSECVLEQSNRSQPLDRPGRALSRCTALHVGDAAALQVPVDCSNKASNMLSSPTSSKRNNSDCVMVACDV